MKTVMGPKRSSAVWRYFDERPDKHNAICNICGIVLKIHGRSTTTLHRHLKGKHKIESLTIPRSNMFGQSIQIETEADKSPKPKKRGKGDMSASNVIKEQYSPTPGSEQYMNPDIQPVNKIKRLSSVSVTKHGSSDVTKVKTNSSHLIQKKKCLDDKLAAMIASELLPVSIVESKGFVEFMSVADPQYTIPSRKNVSKELLPNLYKETVEQVMKKLEGADHIALTTDMWSPRDQETYLSVTAHYITTTDWVLESVMLSTTVFFGDPTGKEISSELQRVVGEWNISEKITVMVADDVTNTILANEHLPWAYVPCLGHLVHLVVTDAIAADKESAALIDKVYRIVSYFQHSPEATEHLLATQKSMALEISEPKLIISVPERWNSTFYMLERLYDQIDAVNAVLELHNMADNRLSTLDTDNMKLIISSLKPFEVATKTLSSDKSNNIGMALPLIKGLVTMMSSLTGAKEPLTQNLSARLVESFGKIEEIEWIVTATLLDPRFKSFPFAEKNAIEKAKDIIVSEVSQLVGGIDSSQDGSKTGEGAFWKYLTVMTNGDQDKSEVPSAASREVQRYWDSQPVPNEEHPLFYWKQHLELYPNLCKVALKYMTVPITSIPTDRLFTKAGDSMLERRSMLKPKNVNMILFLHNNL